MALFIKVFSMRCLVSCCGFLIVCSLLVFLSCLWAIARFGSLVVDLFVFDSFLVWRYVVVLVWGSVGCVDTPLWGCFGSGVSGL